MNTEKPIYNLYFGRYSSNPSSPWFSLGSNKKVKQTLSIASKYFTNFYFINYTPKENNKIISNEIYICSSLNPIIFNLQILTSLFKLKKNLKLDKVNLNLIIYNADFKSFLFYFSSRIFGLKSKLILQIEDLPNARKSNIGLKGFINKLTFIILLKEAFFVYFASKGMEEITQLNYQFGKKSSIYPPSLTNTYLKICSKRRQPFLNKFTKIVYAGSFHDDKGIYELIDAFIQSEIKNGLLQLYGPINKKIRNIVSKNNSIKLMGVVPIEELYMAYSNCDILVNPHKKVINNSYIFPCKNIEILASGAFPLMSKYSLTDFNNPLIPDIAD